MQASVAAGGDAFALALYQQLKTEAGNLFYSPFSLRVALAMTFAGARGETEREMAAVLGLPGQSDAVHAAMGNMVRQLNQRGGDGVQLRVANALWMQSGFAFQPSYTSLVETQYDSQPLLADFASDTEGARERINAWVAERTENRIRNLIPPGALNALTRLVLTNAIYFKGLWSQPFDPADTADAPFWLTADTQVSTPFMTRRGEMLYAEDEVAQVLSLPYKGGALSMLVFLPPQHGGLGALEAALTSDRLEQWLRALEERPVELYLPRFRIEARFSLADTLAAMGMPSAFHGADFSGISEAGELEITGVLHKAFVEVNEEGSEAAAATGVVVGITSVREPAPPVVFRADRPFLFAIRDNGTRSLLFLGRLADPRS